MNGVVSDYGLKLSSLITTDSCGVALMVEPILGLYLNVMCKNDGVFNSKTFRAPKVMRQLELGVDSGVVNVKLGDTLYNMGLNAPDLGISTKESWFIEVGIRRGLGSIAKGVTSVRLMTRSTQGLTLPTFSCYPRHIQ